MESKLSKNQLIEMIKAKEITPEEGIRLLKEMAVGQYPSTLFFVGSWQPGELSIETSQVADSTDLLLFDTEENLARVLRNLLASTGRSDIRVLLIKPGQEYRELGELDYEIAPDRPEDYRQLVERLQAREFVPANIVYLWGRSPDCPSAEAALEKSVYSVFNITQALLEKNTTGKIRLLYLYPATGEMVSTVSLTGAAMSGFARSARLENPNLIYKVIELQAGCELLDIIMPELQPEADDDVEVSYRQGQRYVRKMEEFTPVEVEGLSFKEKGVYLITGGAGGLGHIFAKHLAVQARARLVLTGRSAVTEEITAKLRELELAGAEAIYIQADAAKRDQVEAMMQEAKARFGGINGIIHSAGLTRDALISKKTRAEIEAVLAPKVYGTINLDEASLGEPLDFFVLFSSVSGALGNVGQCDYAYGNSFMDNYAELREALRGKGERQGKSLSVNWPLWKEGGMQVDSQTEELLAKVMGMTALETEAGKKAFELGLTLEQPRFMVLTGNREKIRQMPQLKGKQAQGRKEAPRKVGSEVEAQFEAKVESKSAEKVESQSEAKVLGYFQQDLVKTVAEILRIQSEDLDLDGNMSDFGFNSITFVELTNHVNEKFGIEITPTVLFEHPTLRGVVKYLFDENKDKMFQHYSEKLATVPGQVVEKTTVEKVGQNQLKSRLRDKSMGHRRGQGSNLSGNPLVSEEPIAVIGMGGVMPQSPDLDIFWQHLEQGHHLISEVPEDRWDWREYYGDPQTELNKTNVKWAGFMPDVDKFDPLFFGISPREAELMDPQQRIFLETVWKTIEDAGYDPAGLSGTRTGIFVGVANADYYDLLKSSDIGVEAYSSTGASHCILANRISYLLNLLGPSEPVDTACSSSLVAIHRGVEAIRNGSCEMAIAGGVNTILSPTLHISFSKAGMLCEDGKCKTFDKKANGYVRGEGAGAILLKPLSKALADGDHIYAVIKSTAVNHGGRANSLTAPNPNAQAELLVTAYKKAGVDPSTVTYIEAHGTGTSLGDPIEIEGLKKAFKELYKARGVEHPPQAYCGIGSVKTNVGHLETAAGVAGVIKVLLALKNAKIPAHLHFEELNPYIQLEGSPFYIVDHLQNWNTLRDDKGVEIPRRAGVSSFGFGGANAHIVLEEYRSKDAQKKGIEPQLIVLSAKTDAQLKESAIRLTDYLERHELDLHNVAYTLQVGRKALDERLAFLASDMSDLKEKLAQFISGTGDSNEVMQGSIKSNKTITGVLTEGAEGQEFVRGLIRNKKFIQLGRLWISGVAVDWTLLHEGHQPARISLPTYPFARKRYWIPRSENRLVTRAIKGRGLHTLIDTNESTLSEQCYKKIFFGEEFYLTDHVINGDKMLPGVIYLELARAAGTMANDNRPVKAIRDITWAQPLTVLEEPRETLVTLMPKEDRVDYRIVSIVGEARHLHSQGKLLFDYSNDIDVKPEVIEIPEIRVRCPASLTGPEIYSRFRAKGFAYGSGFQAVTELWKGVDEALARIELPSVVTNTFDQFTIHPSIYDGALQTIGGLLAGGGDDQALYLPFSIEELELLKPLTPVCYVYVRPAWEPLSESDVLKFNLWLTDTEGSVLSKIGGFGVRAIRTNENKSQFRAEPLYYHPLWEIGNDDVSLLKDANFSGDILLFDTEENPARVLRNLLVSTGRSDIRVLLIKPGQEYRELGELDYEIAPDRPEDYRQLVERLQAREFVPANIVYLWGRTPDCPSAEVALEKSVYSVFNITQALSEKNTSGKTRLLYLYPATGEMVSTVSLTGAAMSGFARSARLENPKLIYKVIELQAGCELLDIIIPELQPEADDDVEVSYRQGQRYVRKMEEFTPVEVKGLPFREKGVYLITGGAGGLGQIFAKHLAVQARARLVLTGRSAATEEITAKLRELESAGAEAIYIQADVAKRDQVEAMMQEVKARFGAINGIIHSAGLTRDALISKKTRAEIEAVLAPKVYGTINLDEASLGEPLDFFVLFSSVSGALGNVGQCDYAYGNSFMDNYAELREALRGKGERQGKSLSVNWPLWKEGGMQVDSQTEELLAKVMGMTALETEAGKKAFELGLTMEQPRFMVLAGNREKIRQMPQLKGKQAQGQKEAPRQVGSKVELKSAEKVESQSEAKVLGYFQQDLMKAVSEILRIRPEDLDLDANMSDFGFDSITFTQFTNYLNERYDLDITPALLFGHSTPKAAAEYLFKEYQAQISHYYSDKMESATRGGQQQPVPVLQHSVVALASANGTGLNPRFIKTIDQEQPVAIIGMSGVMPQSPDLDVFWQHLEQGHHLITEVPEGRWDWREYYGDPQAEPNKTNVKWAGFMPDVDKFDPLFFGISPREAELMDPQQRVFLETVWKTIEDAGYKASDLSGSKTGIFVGVANVDYYDLLKSYDIDVEAYSATGASHCILANRISYLLNLLGPSEPIDTACSSSLVAIHRGVEAIRNGSCEMAIAGGVNTILTPTLHISFSKAGMLCEDGKCKTFDKKANGYVRGEGAGAILLKPLSKALADGDHIYAVIKSTAVNHGGRANSLTAPNPNAQAELLVTAYKKAGIDPSTVTYIEAHGTGTSLGDPIEIEGLKKAFKELYNERGVKQPPRAHCGIGSVKTNVGHLETAAGIAGVAKVVLAMQHEKIPATINFDELNPYIKLEETPFYIVDCLQNWENLKDSNGRPVPRRAGVSSFGFGGANAHVVLEEYWGAKRPSSARSYTGAQELFVEPQIIVLSALDEERLREYAGKLAGYLRKHEASQINSVTHRQPIIEHIAADLTEIAADTINVDEKDIHLQDHLTDCGFDALSYVTLINGINDKFDLKLSSAAFALTGSSLSDIAKYLYEKYTELFIERYGITIEHNAEIKATYSVNLDEIAYTLQVGREPLKERLAFVVTEIGQLVKALELYSTSGDPGLQGFRGDIRTGKTKAELMEGEEGREFLLNLIKRKKLEKLAGLWVAGVEIDWLLLYPKVLPNRLSLPTYPFARIPYWIKQVPKPRVRAGYQFRQLGSRACFVLRKTWQESKKPATAIVETNYAQAEKEILLIVNSETEELAGRLFSGKNLVLVHADELKQVGKHLYSGRQFAGLVDLSDIRPGEVSEPKADLEKVQMLQEFIKATRSAPVYLFHITRGLQSYQTEQLTLAGATIAGLVKMLGAEYSNLVSRTIDIDIFDDELLGLEEIIATELTIKEPYGEVCWRRGKRYVPQIEQLFSRELQAGEKFRCEAEDQLVIKTDKAIVITGGTRGLGFQMASYLASKGARKLVLMDRHPLPPKAQWQFLTVDNNCDPLIKEKVANLSALEEKGVSIRTYSGSLDDLEAMGQFFQRVMPEFGELGGVIHCAGCNFGDSPAFINKPISDIEKNWEPKVTGLIKLHQLLTSYKPEFYVLFSSVSAVIPALASGVSDYAAANSFMDYFADYWQHKGDSCFKSINWPHWIDGGMGGLHSPVYSGLGLVSHSIDEGLAMLEQVMLYQDSTVLMPCIAEKEFFHRDTLIQTKNGGVKTALSPLERPKLRVGEAPLAHKETQIWLTELFSQELKIPVDKLDLDTYFGDYGVDSILLAELIKKAEARVGQRIEPAVFLEYPTLRLLSGYLDQMGYLEQVKVGVGVPLNTGELPVPPAGKQIAIIGMACNFPGAGNRQEFWANLAGGISSISLIPASRWDIDSYYERHYKKGKSISKWGGFIDNIEYFDAGYFKIREELAPHIDPLMRQFLEISVQTLRDAGYSNEELGGKKVGVFIGARTGSYPSGIAELLPDTIVGTAQNFIAAHVSHFFNFKGPSMVLDTACSSSLVSLHLACQSLLAGDCEAALAGGVEILIDETPYLVLSEGRALSPDGKCHTFDSKANGFVPGEGCGAVLLKTLDQALADGDQIYAVIDSSAINNDGHTMGITTPNPEAQKDVIRQALLKGNIDPATISYLEAHGTGTMIGDPIELKALTETYREWTEERAFCPIGSVKTNIGHLLSAAGIASLIKVVLSIINKEIPPTLNCDTPNPRFNFEESPFYPNLNLVKWVPRKGIRRAGISSFGFGGTNAHVLVSEYAGAAEGVYSSRRMPLPAAQFARKRYWNHIKYGGRPIAFLVNKQLTNSSKDETSNSLLPGLEIIDETGEGL